jgi:hypothetical protein
VVPILTFERLFAFLVLGYSRRQLLCFEVTRHPTAEWLARQITEAFPWASGYRAHPRSTVVLIRNRGQLLGYVEAASLETAEIAAAKTFNLTIAESRSDRTMRQGMPPALKASPAFGR